MCYTGKNDGHRRRRRKRYTRNVPMNAADYAHVDAELDRLQAEQRSQRRAERLQATFSDDVTGYMGSHIRGEHQRIYFVLSQLNALKSCSV